MSKIFDIQSKHQEKKFEAVRQELKKCTPFFRHLYESQLRLLYNCHSLIEQKKLQLQQLFPQISVYNSEISELDFRETFKRIGITTEQYSEEINIIIKGCRTGISQNIDFKKFQKFFWEANDQEFRGQLNETELDELIQCCVEINSKLKQQQKSFRDLFSFLTETSSQHFSFTEFQSKLNQIYITQIPISLFKRCFSANQFQTEIDLPKLWRYLVGLESRDIDEREQAKEKDLKEKKRFWEQKKRNEKVDGLKRMISEYLNNKKLTLVEFFQSCDENKDGVLDFFEFQNLLNDKLLIGKLLEPDAIQLMFEGCDIDSDQKISQLDFQRLFNQTFTTHQFRELILEYLKETEINMETFFRQSDPEDTGYISRKNFELAIKRMEKEVREKMMYGDEELEDVFEKIQTQKEYRISFSELQEFVYGKDKVSMETLIYKLYQFINYFDTYQLLQKKDQYKQLGFKEFGDLLEGIGVKLELNEKEFLFKEFDKDGSGSIDLDEFSQGMNEIMWRYKHKRLFFERISGKTDRQFKSLPANIIKIYSQLKEIKISQYKFVNIFGFYDSNKDGLVNYQQFATALRKLEQSVQTEKPKLDGEQYYQIFKFYDEEFKSGFIQWEEIMLDMLQYDILVNIEEEQREKEKDQYSFDENSEDFTEKSQKEKEKYLCQFYYKLHSIEKQKKVDLSQLILRNYDKQRTQLIDFNQFSDLLNSDLNMRLRYEELQQLFQIFDSKKQYKINWVQILKNIKEYESSDKFNRFYQMQQKQQIIPLVNQMHLMHKVYDVLYENLFKREQRIKVQREIVFGKNDKEGLSLQDFEDVIVRMLEWRLASEETINTAFKLYNEGMLEIFVNEVWIERFGVQIPKEPSVTALDEQLKGVITILMNSIESGRIDLYEVFCQFDTDKDGRITYEEFWVMFGGMLHLFDKDVRKLFIFLDENDSGFVGWEELIKGLEIAKKQGVKEKDRYWMKQFEQNVRIENQPEKNKEMLLFKKLEALKGEDEITDPKLISRELEIGQAENVQQLVDLISKSWTLNLIQVFKTFDVNFDGKLVFNEFQYGLASSGYILTKNDYQLLFRYFDKDNTGEITIDEFVQTIYKNIQVSQEQQVKFIQERKNEAKKVDSNLLELKEKQEKKGEVIMDQNPRISKYLEIMSIIGELRNCIAKQKVNLIQHFQKVDQNKSNIVNFEQFKQALHDAGLLLFLLLIYFNLFFNFKVFIRLQLKFYIIQFLKPE